MNHPTTGGSYRREKDGSLTRIDAPAKLEFTPGQILPVPELPAEPATTTETPAEDTTQAKKGKA